MSEPDFSRSLCCNCHRAEVDPPAKCSGCGAIVYWVAPQTEPGEVDFECCAVDGRFLLFWVSDSSDGRRFYEAREIPADLPANPRPERWNQRVQDLRRAAVAGRGDA